MKKIVKDKIKILETELELADIKNLDILQIEKLISHDNIKKILEEIKTDLPINNQSIDEIVIMNLTKSSVLRDVIRFYLECQDITINENLEEDNEIIQSTSFSQYLKEISKYPLLTPEQEKEYFTKLQAGEKKYKDIIIASNLRLVVSIAKRHIKSNYSIEDAIQDGNLGLMKAVEKFDVNKGYKFSTYATWWIRQNINRSIADNSRTIRIPVHRFEEIKFYENCLQKLYVQKGRCPSEQEVAEYMTAQREESNGKIFTTEDIKKLKAESVLPISLSTPIGEEDDFELGDVVKDENIDVEEEVANLFLQKYIEELLSTLSKREREVIKMRYGIGYEKAMTLQDVGKEFHVTRERIRQIEAKALRLLKHPKRSAHLRDYIK